MKHLVINLFLIVGLGSLVSCGITPQGDRETSLNRVSYCDQNITVYQFYPTGRGNCLKADPYAPNKIKSDPCSNDYSTMWLKLSGGRKYKNIRYPEIVKTRTILGSINGPVKLSRTEASKHGALGTYAKNRCWQ